MYMYTYKLMLLIISMLREQIVRTLINILMIKILNIEIKFYFAKSFCKMRYYYNSVREEINEE